MPHERISKSKVYLSAFKHLADLELEQISDYADMIERFLSGELKEFEAQMTERAQKLEENERSELYEHYSDDFAKLADEFPNIMRASLFTYTYSFLEHGLVNLCDNCHRRGHLALAPSDLKGEGILRAKTYLKKVAGLNFPDNTRAWQDINTLRKIRNVVIHSDGRLQKDSDLSKELPSFLRRFPSVKVDGFDTLRFSKDFIPGVLAVVRTFLNELLISVAKKLDD